ncbi:MAG: DUF2380 domain-containing protein [Chitinivibrionales bacterium]|nr:DUF2380 domain-containing protein [Chitinivibrionales bacterium]
MRSCVLSCIVVVAFDCVAQSEKPYTPEVKKSVALNGLAGRGIDNHEAATLTDVLRTEIINTGRFQMMERSEMEEILKEQAFQHSGACNEEACVVEMGQILGIDQMISGSVGKVGKAYSINVRVVEVRSGKIVNTVAHTYTGPIEGLLTTEMKVVAKKLAGIETVFKQPKAKGRSKAPFIITGAAVGLAAVGGAIAYFALFNDKDETNEDGTATVEVTWPQ